MAKFLTMDELSDTIYNPRFVGLWKYRPVDKAVQFCATVIVEGEVNETGMHDSWTLAVDEAAGIIEETE